jgi:enoyl-[acyl-carrier protein] reductase II
MTWISDSTLVSAVDKAGGIAFLAGGNMPPNLLKKEIEILKGNKINFGVNLITIAPLFEKHLELVTELKVPYIVFAGSFPRKYQVEKAKESGAKVLCFASTESIARRMIDYGADGLIMEGNEAGGHIGHVSTIVLIQQVLFEFPEVPIFVAGGIATGKMLAHLFLMGAAGVQMGTIFAMAEESPGHPKFKERYKKANSREAFSTPEYDSSLPVVSVRALKNKGTKDFGRLQLELLKKIKDEEISRIEAQYKVEEYWMGALRKAVVDGDIENGSLMAGQSVGLVNEIKSVKDIIADIYQEAEKHYDLILSRIKS